MHRRRARILSVVVVASTMVATYALSSPRLPGGGAIGVMISYPNGDPITAPPGQSGSAQAIVSGPDNERFAGATLTGGPDLAAFSFISMFPCDGPGDPHSCTPMATVSINTVIAVACMPPNDTILHTATIHVSGMGPNGLDVVSADIHCLGNGADTQSHLTATLDNNGAFDGVQGMPIVTTLRLGPPDDKMIGATINGDSSPFRFDPAACGPSPTVCNPTMRLDQVNITCTPPDASSTHMAFLDVEGAHTANGSDEVTLTLACEGSPAPPVIQIQNPEDEIAVPADGSNVAQIGASAPDQLVSATVFDKDTQSPSTVFSFQDCPGQPTCTFSNAVLGTRQVGIHCHAPDDQAHLGTLSVFGAANGGGSSDEADKDVRCQGNGSGSGPTGPTIAAPPSVDLSANVGASSEGAAFVSDSSFDGPLLTFTATLTSGSSDFTVEDCHAAACTVGKGMGSDVNVRFTPTVFGTQQATLEIDSNATNGSAVSVIVTGHGSGAELELSIGSDDGSDTETAIGPIPLDQVGSATYTVTDNGNIALPTAVSGSGAPFGFPAQVSPTPGNPAPLTVTCQSAAPTNGVVHGTFTVSAPLAYKGATQTRRVSCEVADTHVQVDPTSFDFGEVREGAPAPRKTLTIRNPTASTITVQSIALVRADGSRATGLTLPAVPSTPLVPVTGALSVDLTLMTNDETDLNDPRTVVAIDIQEADGHTTHLELRVTGSVVVASSTVAPDPLDLGTACIGHAVTADEVFTNTGTATLHLQAPAIDSHAFAVSFADPTMYPIGGATIAPHATARATISPASTAAGTYAGMLTWIDDVPSTHTVPVSVSYKSEGTAISPLGLGFATVEIGVSSAPGLVRLENCGGDDTQVTIGDVAATDGSPTAWDIGLGGGRQKLPGHGALVVPVTFVPNYPGQYTASLQLVVDGKDTAVMLSGFAEGKSIRHTFYGCGCSSDAGAGGELAAFGVAGALWLGGRRRRRR